MISKTTLALVLVILFAWHAPAAGQESRRAPEWGRYMFPGDEFSVELPGEPFVFRTGRYVNSRHPHESMRVFGHYSAGAVYMVAAFDKPHGSESFDDFVSYIHSRQAFVNLSKRDAALGGFKGREYDDGGRLKYRVFRTPERAYLVWADGEEAGAARFLNSLRLSPTPEGAEIKGAAPPRPTVTLVPENDGPFKNTEVTSRAVIVYKPEPHFTDEARQNNVTGVVRLRAVLSSSGRVTNISIIKALPDGLTEQAILAARHLMFFPARKDGREVSQYVVIEYNFNIY